MFEKQIVIDGKGHLAGRLASVIAKELLNGQRVVVVRAEQINISGELFRRRLDYLKFLTLKSNTNPRRGGPYHFKAPSRLFWRAVRGMMPHKTARGAAALGRLKIFEGMPFPYSHKTKQVVTNALRVVRLKKTRKFTTLGALSASVGWNKGDIVSQLETKREQRASEYHKNKMTLVNATKKQGLNLPEIKKIRQSLEKFGY
eukprot:TRINITY_DN56972_c0_g1_i1.p1 TRINITY_DN56972_c0_g1~~TRINITY_DN56972_c0_g1_i1.p1  ORF type:complete len:201 (+),score=41.78 TRINITY_DN56972_c0_g1_i1:3-605(+)